MNILMVVTWYSAYDADTMTAGVFHYEQAIALQKYCETALYYPYDKDLQKDFQRVDENGLLTYRRKNRKNKYINRLHIFRDLYRIRKEFKPDIIHAHVALQAGKMAVIFGKIFGIPVVITEHTPIELARLDNKRALRMTRFAFHNSKANICVSKDSKKRLQTFFPKEDFRVIYNGIINPEKIERDKNKYYKNGYINCCIVAAFYDKEIKGYQYLLPAIQKLVEEGYSVVLHICGGGEYFEYYRNLAIKLGIENNCIFYGQCERKKVYSVISQMDFSISSSIFECSGVSVQEAMLLGKPLVVTKSGGANSLVTEDTAIIVERMSTDALVNGIKKMLEHLSDFDEKSIKAYARERFEIDEVSRKYMELYKEVLNQN